MRLHHEHTYADKCRSTLEVLHPRAFASGTTAAVLHGLPIPATLRDRLELAVPAPARAVRRVGVKARSLRIDERELTNVGGVRVTTLSRTWCELARTLTLPQLVAAADVAVRLVGVDRLERAATYHPDRRLHARLATALDLVDAASESPKESELRALIVLAGLPRPRVNVEVRDERGRFVARVDLLFEEFGEIIEYQGDHHRTDVRQWRRDRTREAELEALGFHVTEVTQADLDDPHALIRRIAANLRRRGWRSVPNPSRWFPDTLGPRSPTHRQHGS
ncbi:hypothetical protein DSM26151_01850 [Agromyces marinus]|nr:hypothetical protein DSM26151_01850 [Agromyces marinus]